MLRKPKKPLFFCLCLMLSSFTFIPPNEINYANVDYQNVPLDHKIAELIGIRNGVFVEVGAYDGIVQSNTKLLEDFYGWTGVLIEPSAPLFTRLVSNRPHSQCFQCALGTHQENGTYLHGDFDGILMSSVNGSRLERQAMVRTPVRSLQSILDEVNLHHINFFSLDVEGYELQVLKGIDFGKTLFDYILIEIYSSDYDQVVEFMKTSGYALMENFSNYNKTTNPDWDGTHNDYLFIRMPIVEGIEEPYLEDELTTTR